MTRATFVSKDLTRGGSWKGAYGAAAVWIAGGGSASPSGATVAITPSSATVWVNPTTNPKCLYKVEADERLAAGWFDEPVTADLTPPAGRWLFTAYVFDYYSAGRTYSLAILDPTDDSILDTRATTVGTDANNGVYFTWEITGPVRLVVTTGASNKAEVAGLFLDPVAAAGRLLCFETGRSGLIG